jgi:hypothetical protein
VKGGCSTGVGGFEAPALFALLGLLARRRR